MNMIWVDEEYRGNGAGKLGLGGAIAIGHEADEAGNNQLGEENKHWCLEKLVEEATGLRKRLTHLRPNL